MEKIIYSVSAPLGSGKTTAAIKHIGNQVTRGQKVVIAQPSIVLLDQTFEDFKKAFPKLKATRIHGEIVKEVAKKITEHVKESDSGEVLFITHSALIQCPYWEGPEEWHLLIDETPQIFFSENINLPKNRAIILPALKAESYNVEYARLMPGDQQLLRDIAKNAKNDQVYKIFKDWVSKLLSGKWQVYALNEQWGRFTNDKEKGGQLTLFGLLDPTALPAFASTTIMSANLENTLYYRHLIELGYTFKPSDNILKKLRYRSHENGNLLDIHYAIQDSNWSKGARNKPVQFEKEQYTINEILIFGSQILFKKDQFVWLVNKDLMDKNPFEGKGICLPHSPHGLNQYSEIHNAAILPALNPSPVVYSFLEDIAHFNTDDIRAGIYHEAVYQAVGRISLRNPTDINRKQVVVPDLGVAEFLRGLFPGATLIRLPGSENIQSKKKSGRKRIHTCDAARKFEHRKQHKLNLLNQLDLLNGERGETISPIGLKVVSSRPEEEIGGSIFDSIYCSKSDYQFIDTKREDFEEFLRDMHKRSIPKEDAFLWSPAVFDPSKSERTDRGLANIVAISGIWLDNDGGDLSIDEFTTMFPQLEMIIYNSASSTQKNPRWRAIIHTTCRISIDVHHEIMVQLSKSLNKKNYYGKQQLEKKKGDQSGMHHGFDTSKFTPSSLFYLPVQAIAGSQHSFFLKYSGENRKPINPYHWVDRSIINHEAKPEPEIPSISSPIIAEKPNRKDPKLNRFIEKLQQEEAENYQQKYHASVEHALQEWRTHPRGTGNQAFFQLAASLNRAGMDIDEIQQTLHQQVVHAHGAESQGHRRAAIPGIMETIRRG